VAEYDVIATMRFKSPEKKRSRRQPSNIKENFEN